MTTPSHPIEPTPDRELGRGPGRGLGDPLEPLAEQLATTAALLDIGEPQIERVLARSRQREQRTRAAIGTVSVIAVVAASLAAVSMLSRPSHTSIVASPSSATAELPEEEELPTAPDGVAPVGDAIVVDGTGAGPVVGVFSEPAIAPEPLPDGTPVLAASIVDPLSVWNAVIPDSTEALATFDYGSGPSSVGTGPYVAWSTAPGASFDYAGRLWRSDDGTAWNQVADPPPLAPVALAATGGQFFAVGTSPAAAPADGRKSDIGVARSTDGSTWTMSTLPIDTSALADEPGVTSVAVAVIGAAAAPGSVVVAAQVMPIIDYERLLDTPAQLAGYNPTREGIQVYSTVECFGPDPVTGVDPCLEGQPIDRTIAWTDIGISQTVVDAMFESTVHIFCSPDGVTFFESPLPDVGDETLTSVRLASLDSGFAMLVNTLEAGEMDGTLFDSPDGYIWTASGLSPIRYPITFQGAGDRLLMTGTFETASVNPAPAVAVREGGEWAAVDLGTLVQPDDGAKAVLTIYDALLDQRGITVLGSISADPVAELGGLEMTRAGVVLRAEDSLGSYQLLDATTRELIGSVADYLTTTGDVEISAIDGSFELYNDDGSLRVRFTPNDISVMFEPAYTGLSDPVTVVLQSDDGVNWSREALTDLAGAPARTFSGLRSLGDRVVVAANLDERNADATAKQVLLIGTPIG